MLRHIIVSVKTPETQIKQNKKRWMAYGGLIANKSKVKSTVSLLKMSPGQVRDFVRNCPAKFRQTRNDHQITSCKG